jgi:deoxycytidine triphosphate deaminase
MKLSMININPKQSEEDLRSCSVDLRVEGLVEAVGKTGAEARLAADTDDARLEENQLDIVKDFTSDINFLWPSEKQLITSSLSTYVFFTDSQMATSGLL